MAPKIRPANNDPKAYSANSAPAVPGYPAAFAKATVVTSNDPKIPPISRKIAVMPATPGSRMAGRPPRALARPEGTGSVRRWVSSSSVPTASSTVARTSAALGNSCRATTVAKGGPKMKTASSISDSHANATRNCGVPLSSADQRVRTSGPMIGCEAPATMAIRKIGQVRSVATATNTMAAIAGTCTANSFGTTRSCP